MLSVGVMLDLTGFIIFIIGTWLGVDDYGILDIIGLGIIGVWLYMKHRSAAPSRTELKEELGEIRAQKVDLNELNKKPESPQKDTGKSGRAGLKNPKSIIKNEAKEYAKKILKRFGLAFVLELIPFVGGFIPAWTWLVYKHLD